MTYLIKAVRVAAGDTTDLLLRDGRIVETGANLSAAGAETVDGDGLVALPGLVDLHTHLREPGREDAETVESGSRAAALGGYTAVCAMANTSPVADTAGVVEQVYRLGRQAGLVDVQPVGAVTVGLAGERMAELGAMAASAAQVRIFSDDGHCVADPRHLRGRAAGSMTSLISASRNCVLRSTCEREAGAGHPADARRPGGAAGHRRL